MSPRYCSRHNPPSSEQDAYLCCSLVLSLSGVDKSTEKQWPHSFLAGVGVQVGRAWPGQELHARRWLRTMSYSHGQYSKILKMTIASLDQLQRYFIRACVASFSFFITLEQKACEHNSSHCFLELTQNQFWFWVSSKIIIFYIILDMPLLPHSPWEVWCGLTGDLTCRGVCFLAIKH